jgi:hypothetical protein
VTRGRTEMKRLHYLSLHAPGEGSCKNSRSMDFK